MRSHKALLALACLATLVVRPALAQSLSDEIDHVKDLWGQATEVFNGDAAKPPPPADPSIPPRPVGMAAPPPQVGFGAYQPGQMVPGQAGFQVPQVANPQRAGLSDNQVRDQIVREHLAQYQASGRCFCPDQLDNRGQHCGARAAYGHVQPIPICYISQVEVSMIWQWRSSHPGGR